MQQRLTSARKPKVRRATTCSDGLRGDARLDRITGHEYFHARQSRHDSNIFNSVMRVALAAVGIAGTDGDDLNVRTVIADIVPNLLKAAQGREVTNRIDENRVSAKCDSGSYTRHVLLRDAHIEISIGETRGKWFQHGVPQVPREKPAFWIFRGHIRQGSDKIVSHAPISAKAAFSC